MSGRDLSASFVRSAAGFALMVLSSCTTTDGVMDREVGVDEPSGDGVPELVLEIAFLRVSDEFDERAFRDSLLGGSDGGGG